MENEAARIAAEFPLEGAARSMRGARRARSEIAPFPRVSRARVTREALLAPGSWRCSWNK